MLENEVEAVLKSSKPFFAYPYLLNLLFKDIFSNIIQFEYKIILAVRYVCGVKKLFCRNYFGLHNDFSKHFRFYQPMARVKNLMPPSNVTIRLHL